MNITRLTQQVQHNCDVSDAQYAGIYSVCGLAMRLRDLYKWDQRLQPWEEHEACKVLDWIGQREELWESLEGSDFEPLVINGDTFDPFETEKINQALEPQNLFYGAGYAHSLKPTFFLAQIKRELTVRQKKIWELDRELARDLLTLPAFSQDDQVVLRTQAARMYLWDQITYMQNKGRSALAYGLAACCNLPDTNEKRIRKHLDSILKIQQNTYIQHELSEMEEQIFDHATWRQMMAQFPHTAVELLIRTLKDMLADTCTQGPLRQFCTQHNKAGLGFYMAFSGGLAPHLFGELKEGFDHFLQNGDWTEIENAVSAVHQKASAYTQEVIDLYTEGCRKQDPDWAQSAIEETLNARGIPMSPLNR